MKKVLLFIFVFQFIVCTCVFAQIAKIVDVSGDVSVRGQDSSSWQKAKPDMYLDNDSEVKTGFGSECTIAFDEDMDNILTIKDGSHIKIEDVKKGKIYLPKGRVFSLIDDLAKLEDFQVRTPTAIAGVKGTGESVQTNGFGTSVKCFIGKAFAQGIDKDGNLGEKKDITKGFGIDALWGGILGDIFGLDQEDWKEWEDFKEGLKDILSGHSKGRTRDRGRYRDFPIDDEFYDFEIVGLMDKLRDVREEGKFDIGDGSFIRDILDRIRDWWENKDSRLGDWLSGRGGRIGGGGKLGGGMSD